MENFSKVDIGLTYLFSMIYGQEKCNLKENATLRKFKENFSKLLITIKKSFLDTCEYTDKNHRDEIIKLINDEVEKIKEQNSIIDLHTSLIIFFPKLCFLLIGHIPQNFTKPGKDNRSSWNLNEYRQVEYKQSHKQKRKLLNSLLINEKIADLKSYKLELRNYHNTQIKGEDFLNWFKRKYPHIYVEIFD